MAVTTRPKERGELGRRGNGELESFNPATGERIGAVPTITPSQVQSVVDDVAEVQPFWAQLSLAERARYLRRAAQVLVDHSDEIAELLTREQGKPRVEAYTMEVLPTIDLLALVRRPRPADPRRRADQVHAAHAQAEEELLQLRADRRRRRDRALELSVVDPVRRGRDRADGRQRRRAEAGVADAADRAEDPGGVRARPAFPRASCERSTAAAPSGRRWSSRPPGKIFFTGSVEVGRRVGEACARRMKGSVLELGGKDPQIVCADANLPNAISGAVWGGFANAGQTCSGIERVYVLRDVADRFIDGVVRRASALKVGDPLQWDTEIGPMVSKEQFDLVNELVDDAIARGREAALRRPDGGRRASAVTSSRRPC